MTSKIALIFILIQAIYSAQTDNGIEKKYYRNGKVKFIATKHGIDTIELKGYYKNGQLKDSVWLFLTSRREVPIRTGKTFYSNGSIESITHYKNGNEEYTSYIYHRNGQLKGFVQTPTGLSKFYNKEGEQIREFDHNKSQEIYVSKNFRKGRHLMNSNYTNRIKSKKALLVSKNKKTILVSGVLISLLINSDTTLLTHCQIEGFSKDSMYLSKFSYNEDYSRDTASDILKFDSTFVIGFNQLDVLFYAKHKDRRRSFGALTTLILGTTILATELLILPILPFIVNPLGTYLIDVAYYYATYTAVGITLCYYSKYLYKTAVPKKYDLESFKIAVKI